MFSTVLSIGAIIALIGGVAYFFFQYMPIIIDFWNHCYNIYWSMVDWIPEELQPFCAITLLLAGVTLLIKLL